VDQYGWGCRDAAPVSLIEIHSRVSVGVSSSRDTPTVEHLHQDCCCRSLAKTLSAATTLIIIIRLAFHCLGCTFVMPLTSAGEALRAFLCVATLVPT